MTQSTIFLDPQTWDLVLDASGNIAAATDPYAQAQDAASAARTFDGECYFDTTLGVPYLAEILGKSPSPTLIKSLLVEAALTVPNVGAAQVVLTSLEDQSLAGQMQIVSSVTGLTAAVSFVVTNPQGTG